MLISVSHIPIVKLLWINFAVTIHWYSGPVAHLRQCRVWVGKGGCLQSWSDTKYSLLEQNRSSKGTAIPGIHLFSSHPKKQKKHSCTTAQCTPEVQGRPHEMSLFPRALWGGVTTHHSWLPADMKHSGALNEMHSTDISNLLRARKWNTCTGQQEVDDQSQANLSIFKHDTLLQILQMKAINERLCQ